MKIDSKDISVIVQGAIDNINTPKCLISIRKHLPQAEIILSTWKGSNVSGLEYDILVENDDPGSAKMDINNASSYNLNRLLYSTQNGLKLCSRTFVLKLRSDMKLTSNSFLKYFDKFKKREHEYLLARHKILTSSLYTIWAEAGVGKEKGLFHPTPYHISDWWHFGYKEDIKQFFSCPLVDIEQFARYFAYHNKKRNYNLEWLNHRLWKFPPEQYLGVSFAQKLFKNLQFNNCLDYDSVNYNQAEKFLINNFITLDYKQSGILLLKDFYKQCCLDYKKIPPHVKSTMYLYSNYKKLYKKYYKKNILYLCLKKTWNAGLKILKEIKKTGIKL